jgi:3-phosphoshikimate 1-carboxyvinyltransferase
MVDQQAAIIPVTKPLNANVRVPGSKSQTNRALVIAALAEGQTVLRGALFSEDSRYCAEGLARLGFEVALDEAAETMAVSGLGGRIPATRADLFIGNSGTTARFLTALLTLGRGEYVLDGTARMRERPLADLVEGLRQLGAEVEAPSGCPPVRVRAAGLEGGTARVAGNLSSQYLSAMLQVAPYARGPVALSVEGELSSAPYVRLTLNVMADFGVTVEHEGLNQFRVSPQRYRALGAYDIEGDASAASYFFAAPAIAGGTVRVTNVSRQARQGDVAFVDVLARMGCRVDETTGGIAVSGPPEGGLRGVEVDMRHIPDTAQTLAAVAPFANSPTTIRGIASARVKETDRVAATCAELRRLGVRVDEMEDGMTIYPAERTEPAVIETYDDHRMAMAFALVGLRAAGVVIRNPGCVAKTFPKYFDVLSAISR